MTGRPEFNPNEKFVILQPFVCGGERQKVGEPFDPTICTPKTLKQLYDQRRICFASEYRDPTAVAPARKGSSAIDIPENWEELTWPQRRRLASSVSDQPILNGKDAARAITAELERRDQLS